MSSTMRLALLLACVACAGYGRRVHVSAGSSPGAALGGRQRPLKALDADSRRPGSSMRSKALTALLLAGNPAAGIAASRPTLQSHLLSSTAASRLRSPLAHSVLGLRGGNTEEEELSEEPAESASADAESLPEDLTNDNVEEDDSAIDIEPSSPVDDDEKTDASEDSEASGDHDAATPEAEESEDAVASSMKVLENFNGGASGETAEMLLPTTVQVPILITAYLLHLTWISKTKMPLGQRKIPLENVVGAAAVAQYFFTSVRRWWLRIKQGEEATPRSVPWGKVKNGPFTLILTTFMCMGAHWLSNYIGIAFDYGLLYLENAGVPMTWGQAYAMQQLFSHLAYVAMAVHAMGTRLRPFFPPPFGDGEWISVRWHEDWLGWVVGGFYASTLACNALTASCRALYNYLVRNAGLPPAPTDVQPLTETVINQLSRPGGGDIAAFIIGLLAPCVSAPIFEEVLYRGFLLPTLHRFMPLGAALPLQGLLFGLHHRAIPTLLPLSLLGWLWGWFYVRTGNLVIPMLMHAMWNSRSFVNSLLENAY